MTRIVRLWLSLFLSVLSSGCQPRCDLHPNGSFASLGLAPEIQGQIDGWDRGEGFTVVGVVPGNDILNLYKVVKTTAIAADGSFTVPLPDAEALAPYLDSLQFTRDRICGQICPSNVKGASSFFELRQGDVTIGDLHYSVPPDSLPKDKNQPWMFIEFEYTAERAEWIGHCQDPGNRYWGGSLEDVENSYQPGWNVVIATGYTSAHVPLHVSRRITAFAPENARWFLSP